MKLRNTLRIKTPQTEILPPPPLLSATQTARGVCTLPLNTLWPAASIIFPNDAGVATCSIFQIGFALADKVVATDFALTAAFGMQCTPRQGADKRNPIHDPSSYNAAAIRNQITAILPPIDVQQFSEEAYMVWHYDHASGTDAIHIHEMFFRKCVEIDKTTEETTKLWLGVLFGIKLLHELAHAAMFRIGFGGALNARNEPYKTPGGLLRREAGHALEEELCNAHFTHIRPIEGSILGVAAHWSGSFDIRTSYVPLSWFRSMVSLDHWTASGAVDALHLSFDEPSQATVQMLNPNCFKFSNATERKLQVQPAEEHEEATFSPIGTPLSPQSPLPPATPPAPRKNPLKALFSP
ncbi:hypothetical protein HKX48_000007 [Thoreauomyces humboldtii]|nr:hypothetical protein HKX48_000007 [Thoreauomyces humboldtii]